jgi:kumamolisin
MTHHVRDVVRNGNAQANGRLPNNQVLQLDLVLPLRDPSGLKSFLADAYNPSSPNYRQFLTPAEFTARFGPTQEDYDTVLRFATTYGLQVIGGSRDGMEVQVKGTVANIEAAFHVNMRTYQHPTEARTFFSPDHEPKLDLPFNLWHISGLDNFSIPRPLHVSRDEYAAAHGIDADKVVSHATTGSGPSASFLGSDMRAAYYGGTALTGAGQHLGLFEFLGTNLADLNTYYANVHQTNSVPINLISVDGSSTSCVYPGCDDTEQTLDMTQALGMAPGLATLDMYISTTSDVAIISAMTTHNPLPTTIGCSWGWSPVDPSTLDPYFQKMAAQGQNFFAASGDNSTWTKTGNSAAWPADDAYIVSVGGTDLVTASAAGPWKSETAWADSGGGISPDSIAIPSWQKLAGVINSSNKGSTTLRDGPDVAANANFTFYTCANKRACLANTYGGTSFAAPMWAGFIALANQQFAQSNPGQTIGFINPNIYSQNISGGALTSAYAADFHDTTSGTSGSFSAVTGFDLVTGWGSPQAALINALTGPPSPSFTISASPTSRSVTQGSQGVFTITTAIVNGFDAAVSLSASGLPTGANATFNPTSIAAPGSGSSTLTISTSSTTPAGTYNITITGIGNGVTQTTPIALTVTAPQPVYTISASPNTFTVLRGGAAGTSKISAAVTQGSPTIALSASGVPSRVTVTFTPTSITGSTTSTMTVTANKRARAGTYTITVNGTSGSTSVPTTVHLTVQ